MCVLRLFTKYDSPKKEKNISTSPVFNLGIDDEIFLSGSEKGGDSRKNSSYISKGHLMTGTSDDHGNLGFDPLNDWIDLGKQHERNFIFFLMPI